MENQSFGSPSSFMNHMCIGLESNTPFLNMANFHEIIFYLSLRVYVRNPLSNTLTCKFWLGFTSHIWSVIFLTTLTIAIYQFFAGRTTELGKICSDHQLTLLTNLPTHATKLNPPPSHLPIIHLQGNIHDTTQNFVLPFAPGVTFYLFWAKYFICALTLFLLWYFHGLPRSYHPLDAVTRPMDNLHNGETSGTLETLTTLTKAT